MLFGKYAGRGVKVDGRELLVMREEDIMAVVNKYRGCRAPCARALLDAPAAAGRLSLSDLSNIPGLPHGDPSKIRSNRTWQLKT